MIDSMTRYNIDTFEWSRAVLKGAHPAPRPETTL